MPYQSKMRSWNQDYFAGLRAIGKAFSAIPDYTHFSAYCLNKEAGLKKKANKEAFNFVTHVSGLKIERQREIVAELAELNYLHPDVHSLISHPIAEMIKNVLRCWIEDDTNNLIAQRWYGYYGGGEAAFEAALKIDPHDQISLKQLSNWFLRDLDFATHHLDEGFFIGNEAETMTWLVKAKTLINRIEDKKIQSNLFRQCEVYTDMLNVWDSYKKSNRTMTFPEWSLEQGHDFGFSAKFYYKN